MKYLIDPHNITKYDCTEAELELAILFWVCAAGKNGVTAAKCLDHLLTIWAEEYQIEFPDANPSPFEVVRFMDERCDMAEEMKSFGIGCYNSKSKAFRELVWCEIDLNSCTLADLEGIHGIGPKTARCFLIHSRRNQPYAGLDTHVLKFLRDMGHDAPLATPTGRKYRELESVFVGYARQARKSVAAFDLAIWRKYRKLAGVLN